MRRTQFGVILGILLALITTAVLAVPAVGARGRVLRGSVHRLAQTGSTCSASPWHVVSSPNPAAGSGLSSVAAISATDVWAVGTDNGGIGGTQQAIAEHWNGTQWSNVPTASIPNVRFTELQGVAAIATNDVWAVGVYGPPSPAPQETLVEHWNGSQWSLVTSPNSGTIQDDLQSVAAVASNDVWAVGFTIYDASDDEAPLIEHWNGSNWAIVSGASGVPSFGTLNSVAVVSASEIWAVGYSGAIEPTSSLIEKWDGMSWNLVPSPSVGSSDILAAVSASASGVAWVVGSYYDANLARYLPLAEQWGGSTWSDVPTIDGGTIGSGFSGVAVTSTGDTWAVGGTFISTGYAAKRPLIERWNGSSFYVVADGLATGQYGALNSVAAISTDSAWAVGTTGSHNALGSTLTEQYLWPRLSIHC